MKIYVDELPKDCNECPCLNDDIEQGCHCNLGIFDCDDGFKLNKKHPNCPLILITDYTTQVRKDLIKEIDYIALQKQRARPTDLYYCDALWETFIEMLKEEADE